MYLLIECIGEFRDNNTEFGKDPIFFSSMEGFVSKEGRWIGDQSMGMTCYVSPKTDELGYNVGMSKMFWTNDNMKRWKEPRYILVRVDYEYQKNGDWINKLGLIEAIWSEDNTILNELLK